MATSYIDISIKGGAPAAVSKVTFHVQDFLAELYPAA